MKLKEIKNWIESLPEEYLEFDSFSVEESPLTKDGWPLCCDRITSLDVNVENNEIIFWSTILTPEEIIEKRNAAIRAIIDDEIIKELRGELKKK